MNDADGRQPWERMTPEQKRGRLFRKQKETLGRFLERGAISRQQYEKSLHDLTEKMGIGK